MWYTGQKSRSDRLTDLIGVLIAQIFILFPLGGWALMLLLGVLHDDVSPTVPLLGFWVCTLMVALASFVKSGVSPNFPDNK